MSLVSKPYVLDLRPGNSFVEALIGRGFDVYMLDWGVPEAAEAGNSFETYCGEYIPFACAAAMRTIGVDEIDVFGYCFGGMLSLIFATGHPEIPMRTLPDGHAVEFGAIGGIYTVFRDVRIDVADFLDETGKRATRRGLPGSQPALVTGDTTAYAALLANLESSEYIAAHDAMHTWAHDHIPFPGACFKQTTQWLIRENRLAENRLVTARGELDAAHLVPCDERRRPRRPPHPDASRTGRSSA